jgi:hypothetical protein
MSETATAARTGYSLFAGSAYDPVAAGGLFAWQRPTGVALILRGDATQPLPGSHPALAPGAVAWQDGDTTVIADPTTLAPRVRLATPGAGVIALSPDVLAWRTRDAAGRDRLWARTLAPPGAPRLLLESAAPAEIGRPALLGGVVLCHTAGPRGSRLLAIDVVSGERQVLRAERDAQLSNPSTDGARLLYVRATGLRQELRLGLPRPAPADDDRIALIHASPGRRDREREPGRRRHRQGYREPRPPLPPRSPAGVVATLWSTALTAEAAFVTRLRAIKGASPTADILRVPLTG